MAEKTRVERFVSIAIVASVLIVNAIVLRSELAITRIDLNDNVLHYSLVEKIVQAVSQGHNPLDTWSPEWGLGNPVVRTYQPLAHLLVAAVYFLFGKLVPLMTVFVWVRFLSLVLLPLSFYRSARLIGFPYLTSAAAAMLTPFVSTAFLYGMEYGSFTWAGSGLFPQAVATHLLLFSIGLGAVAIRKGRLFIAAGVVTGLTVLTHFIYGYMAAASLVLFALLPDGGSTRVRRIARTAAIGLVTLLISAFQIVPLLADHAIVNHSRWEPTWKWDSFGALATLQRLFTGELLDHGRLPVLTVLAAAGVALWLGRRWRGQASAAEQFAAAGAAMWIVIYFGRSFWGPALSAVGMSEDMHLHRVIGGAQIFLVLLGATAVGEIWTRLAASRRYGVAVVATALLLYPMARERAVFLRNNTAWGERTLKAFEVDGRDLNAAIAEAQQRGGRAYAGLGGNWGAQFKVGDVPVYAFLSTGQVPAVSFLYHSMALTGDVMVRFDDKSTAQQRLFNVRTAIAPINWPLFPPSAATAGKRFGRFQVYEMQGGGYFDLVDATAAVRVTRRNFYDVNDRWLQSDWPAKRNHLLLDWGEGAPPAIPRIEASAAMPFLASPAPVAGSVTAERQSGDGYGADVEALRATHVLFKMAWHPNWKAYVDGAPAAVEILSPGFSAVAVAPGRHRVEFRYEAGWGKTALAIAGALGLALLGLGRRRIGPLVEGAGTIEIPRRWLTAAGVAALALPVALPLMTSAVLAGHDAFEYFPRVIEAHRNLAAGNVLLRWAPDLGRGYGQPLFILRPPLFYWLTELWRVAGANAVLAVNLVAALLVFATAAAMYRLGRLYFGATGGWIASAAFLYAPYFAVDLYVRSALEEFAALPLAALALYGIGAYARERRRRDWAIGALSLGALLACHFPAALLFTPLLAAFAGVTAWVNRSWRLAAEQAVGLVAGVALGAWAWLPAIVEKQYVSMDRLLQGAFHYSAHFVALPQLFSTMWGYGLSVAGPNDGMSFSLGWSQLLIAAAGCFCVWRWGRAEGREAVRFFAVAAAALCFLMLEDSSFVWDRLPLLPFIEFPWRLLGPASLCVAAAAAALGPTIDGLGRWRGAALAGALALLIVPNLSHLAPPRTVDVDMALFTPQQLSERGIETTTMGEVTPRWMPIVPPYDGHTRVNGVAAVTETRRTPFSWFGDVSAKSATRVALPFAYFPGWSARVDGREAPVAPDANGLVEVALAPGEHTVAVKFGASSWRLAGEAISALALIGLALALSWRSGPTPAGEPVAEPETAQAVI